MRHPALSPRRVTRPVSVGKYVIGGDAPVAIQSMTKTDTRDIEATLRQIEQMAASAVLNGDRDAPFRRHPSHAVHCAI